MTTEIAALEAKRMMEREEKAKERADLAAQYQATPKDMKDPKTVRIKSYSDDGLDTPIGSYGLTRNCPGSKKLLPGEVVCLDFAEKWVQKLYARGTLEVTRSPITRPVVFPSERLAHLAKPTIMRRSKSSDPAAAQEFENAMAEIVGKLNLEFDARQHELNSPKTKVEVDQTNADMSPRRGPGRPRKTD